MLMILAVGVRLNKSLYLPWEEKIWGHLLLVCMKQHS